MLDTTTVTATPNPSGLAVTAAGGVSAVLGYGASIVAAKYGVPPEVTVAILTTLATFATSLWHRFFGPKVQVVKPA